MADTVLWTHRVCVCTQGEKVKVKVAQLCLTLCNLIYTVHGILQARILEWVAFPFSRGSSQPRDQTQVSCIADRFITSWAIREPKNPGVDSFSLLQRLFLTQVWNWGLLHCRQILYQLSYQGSPYRVRRERQIISVYKPSDVKYSDWWDVKIRQRWNWGGPEVPKLVTFICQGETLRAETGKKLEAEFQAARRGRQGEEQKEGHSSWRAVMGVGAGTRGCWQTAVVPPCAVGHRPG